MNHPDFKEKTRPPLPGRGFLIMVVIFFSSISFVLGYFVGKNVPEKAPEVFSQVTVTPHASARGTAGEAGHENPALPSEHDPALAPGGEQQGLQADIPMSGPQTKKNTRLAVVSEKDSAATTAKNIPHETRKGNASSEPSGRSLREPRVRYTVQLGALTSASEARKMRARLLKKGYKTYIDISTNGKKNEKIYKIRAGEFEDKKEAEILAVKLKNTEGLQTFVTSMD
jgi:cell division septation protein DedD